MARVLAAPAKVRVEIKGEVFHVQPLLARQGSALLAKLMGLFAAGVGEAKDVGIMGVARAVSRPEAAAVYAEACAIFAASCDVETLGADGQIRTPKLADVFDLFFAQQQALLAEWVIECLRLNFADFIATLEGVGLNLQGAQAAPKSPSPTA